MSSKSREKRKLNKPVTFKNLRFDFRELQTKDAMSIFMIFKNIKSRSNLHNNERAYVPLGKSGKKYQKFGVVPAEKKGISFWFMDSKMVKT